MNAITHIGVEGWIIQDGNYPDFREGQEARFAVEMCSPQYHVTSSGRPKLERLGRGTYDACGPIVLNRPSSVVVDLGFLVYVEGERVLADARVGQWVKAEAYLGVDPYFYFESIESQPWMPPMIYSWRILEIWRDVTPRIEGQVSRVWVRDRSRDQWVRVSATAAFEHEDASYELVCERLPVPPTKVPP